MAVDPGPVTDIAAIRRMEAVAALGWQAPDTAWLGRWLLRAAGGFTGRANSVLPLGPPDRPLAAAVDEVERWYRARDLHPCVAVAYGGAEPEDDPLDALLAARGWTVRAGAALVMTAPSTALPRFDHLDRPVAVEVTTEPDAAWRSCYHYRGRSLPPAAEALLRSAPFQRFATARIDGRAAGIGRVAIAEGWAGLTAMEVEPTLRRRGVGTAVLARLVDVARSEGVEHVYLQVDGTNTGAQALYAAAGLVPRYRYHYRLAPPTAA
jgi:GNAT superfamily N-acetyltransferase